MVRRKMPSRLSGSKARGHEDVYLERVTNGYILKLFEIYNVVYCDDLFDFILPKISFTEFEAVNEKLVKVVREKMSLKKLRSSCVLRGEDGTVRKRQLDELIDDLNRYTMDMRSYRHALENVFKMDRLLYSDVLAVFKKYFKTKQKTFSGDEKSIYEEQLDELTRVFCLNKIERDIITLLYIMETSGDLKSLLNSNARYNEGNLLRTIKTFCKIFDVTPTEIRSAVVKDSKLVISGIIDKGGDTGIELSDDMTAFLSGYTKKNIVDNFLHTKMDATIPLEKHLLDANEKEMLLSLLTSNKCVNILFYGTPGTGKTELARALSAHLGREACFVNMVDEDGEESLRHRKSSLVAAQELLKDKSCILIADECDPIINTTTGMWLCEAKDTTKDAKSWINNFLETAKIKTIWISNDSSRIDDSTKRRFTYAMEFKDLSRQQRKLIWQNQIGLNGIELYSEAEVDRLSSKYRVSAGSIGLAIKEAQAVAGDRSPEDKKVFIEKIIARHQDFIFGKGGGLNPLTESYSVEGLNCDTSLEAIIRDTEQFYKYMNTVGRAAAKISNMNLLLQGPSGTGKTEYVKYLSHRLDRDLVVRRSSDLLSKWVGESEKHIRDAFVTAEAGGNILFIDEADSLFVAREGSEHSWEVTQTNELLTQMENFRGILVCSTNFVANLDPAVMRRFNYKVRFDYLLNEGKLKFYQNILGSLGASPMTQAEINRLYAMKMLTPGDFKVVLQKHFFETKVEHAVLLSALENETRYKRLGRANQIGIRG